MSIHGKNASDFRSRCKGIVNTVTLFKLNNNVTVAGYTSKTWDLQGKSNVKDAEAFLMNLRDNITYKSRLGSAYAGIALESNYGPSWGFGEAKVSQPFKNLDSFTFKVGIDNGISMGYNIGWDGITTINALTGDSSGWGGYSYTPLLEIEVWQIIFE